MDFSLTVCFHLRRGSFTLISLQCISPHKLCMRSTSSRTAAAIDLVKKCVTEMAGEHSYVTLKKPLSTCVSALFQFILRLWQRLNIGSKLFSNRHKSTALFAVCNIKIWKQTKNVSWGKSYITCSCSRIDFIFVPFLSPWFLVSAWAWTARCVWLQHPSLAEVNMVDEQPTEPSPTELAWPHSPSQRLSRSLTLIVTLTDLCWSYWELL